MSEIVKLFYFLGRGRAETTRWMLSINEINFINVPINTPEDLLKLRNTGKLPFDQMPLLEIDGMCLSQSVAMVKYLARLGGYYGSNDKEALYCDMFAGAITDFAEASMQAAFQPTKEIAVKMLQERFNKFAPKFELRIKENGNEFCVGKKISFADVMLTEALSAYVEWIPDLLKNTPLLLSIYEKVINQTGIKLYLSSELRYPIPDEKYIIDVARVLQRALPAHMSDINRFVN
jgi:glutathione S-transferase